LDLHQNDGGMLVTHPQVLGDSTAGIVVEIGPEVTLLAVGDEVHSTPSDVSLMKAHGIN
jgi:Zn-dependent alcohol dehydrogenase